MKLNSNDHFQLSFILFPLKTGLVTAPRLLLEGADASQIPSIYRDHAKSIFIRVSNKKTNQRFLTANIKAFNCVIITFSREKTLVKVNPLP